MDKKMVAIAVGGIILGAAAGGGGTALFFRRPMAEAERTAARQYRDDLGLRTFQAYMKGEPAVGIWALETWMEMLRKQPILSPEAQKMQQADLLLTHGRLAVLYQRQGDIRQYHDQVTQALAIAATEGYGITTEERMLDFVKGIDARAR